MNTEKHIPEEQNENILSVIQKLKDGLLTGKGLDEETRLECVHTLRLEEYTVAQIAQLLKMSDRNIKRDVKKIKERNPIVVDENFEKEFLGEMEQKVLSHCSFFARLSTAKDVPPSDRIQARKNAWEVILGWAKFLQSVGHISQRQYSVGADVYHHLESFAEKDILDIKAAAEQTGLTENLNKLLKDASKEEPEPQKEEEKDNGKEPEK